MQIIKPKALKIGDTLGILACSTPITVSSEETIQRAYQTLRDRGFKLVEGSNCRKTFGHSAGTVKERVKAIHDFFSDPKIGGILNYWGGYQSHQLLEYLDFDLIRKNPKPFIGFSDTTALQIGLYSKVKLVTFSGPAGITFGKPVFPSFTWDHFEKVLVNPKIPFQIGTSKEFSENAWYMDSSQQMHFKANKGWQVFRRGKAKGAIIAGNLGTLLLLAGTSYWPNLKGKILFVEEDESERPESIDRLFTQLRQMGVYAQISGLVVGRFHNNVNFTQNDNLEMILEDALKGFKFPVITGVDFGHTDPLITLPIGIQCAMDTTIPEIVFLERAVSLQK